MFIVNPFRFAATGYQPAGALFFDGSADYLKFTPSSTTGNKKFTFSCWLKKTTVSTAGGHGTIFSAWTDNNNRSGITIEDTGFLDLFCNVSSGGGTTRHTDLHTTSKYYDPTAWFNLILVYDSTVSTPSGSSIFYMINGTKVVEGGYGNLDAHDYATQNQVTQWLTSGTEMILGMNNYGNSPIAFYTGYMADVILLDGIASTDGSEFGELSKGIWVPKDPSDISSFGTNGFWLDFSDGSIIGKDAAGNGGSVKQDISGATATNPGGGLTHGDNAFSGSGVLDDDTGQDGFFLSGNEAGETVDIDLGSGNDLAVTGAGWIVENDSANNQAAVWSIFYSDNGSDWTDTNQNLTVTDDGSSMSEQRTLITGQTAHRYWRLYIDSTTAVSNGWYSGLRLYTGDSSRFANDFTPTSMSTNNIAVDGPANSTTKEITLYPSLDPNIAINQGSAATYTNNNLTVSGNSAHSTLKTNILTDGASKYVWEVTVTKHDTNIKIGAILPGDAVSGTEGLGTNATTGQGWSFVADDASNIFSSYRGTAMVANQGNTLTDGDMFHIEFNNATGDVYVWRKASGGTWSAQNSGTTVVNDTGANNGKTALAGAKVHLAGHLYQTSGTNLMTFNFSGPFDKAASSGYSAFTSTVTGTGNYATLNPLATGSGGTFSNGNLTVAPANLSGEIGTIGLSSGKWYWECTQNANGGEVGVYTATANLALSGGNQANGAGSFDLNFSGRTHNNPIGGSLTTSSPDYTQWEFESGDTVGVALDMDAGKIWFHVNGTYLQSGSGTSGNVGNPAAGSNEMMSGITTTVFPMVGDGTSGDANAQTVNFGQKPFKYAVPSGFNSGISTHMLPEPTVTNPTDYVKMDAYTGNGTNIAGGGNPRVIGFTPDFVLMKQRSHAQDWRLFDTVREAGYFLEPSTDIAHAAPGEMLQSFVTTSGSEGYLIGNNVSLNTDDYTYISLCIKAGGAPTADNTSGAGGAPGQTPTSGSRMFGGSAITTAYAAADIYPRKMTTADHGGFSIVEYVGNGTDNQDVPHGLSTSLPDGGRPGFIIVKRTDSSANWVIGHDGLDVDGDGLPWTDFLNWDVHAQAYDGNTIWSDEPPSPTVFTLGSGGGANADTGVHIAYLFQRTPGLIGFGTFTGNNSTNGPHIIIDDGGSGFKPAWFMFKRTNGNGDWYVVDNGRATYNTTNAVMRIQEDDEENWMGTPANFKLDFVANGVKIRSTNGSDWNGSGVPFLYVAFAESPFGLNNRVK